MEFIPMQIKKHYKPLSAYPEHVVRIALQRERIIQPLINIEQLTRDMVRQCVLEINERAYDQLEANAIKHVSIASIYRWIRVYRLSGGDVRSLLPYIRRQEERFSSRLSPAVNEIIDTAIREIYWSREHLTIDLVQQVIIKRLQEINRTRPESDQLRIPSLSTSHRRIKAWIAVHGEINQLQSSYTVPRSSLILTKKATFLHLQPTMADHHTSMKHQLTRPNQRVECWFVSLDVYVFDDGDILPLGRPTLVIFFDCHTGYLTGCSLSFEPPSPATLLEGLFSSTMHKKDIRSQFGTEHDYLGFGVPEVLVSHHFMEQGNLRLQRFCRLLGIDLRYEATMRPDFHGIVERSFGTLLAAQGLTFRDTSMLSFLQQDTSNQSVGCMTLHELLRILYHWIVDVYAQEEQVMLGASGSERRIPAVLWQQACEQGFVPREPHSYANIHFLLSRVTETTLGQNSVTFEHLRYHPKTPDLLRDCLLDSSTPVRLTYNPADLSSLLVFDPTSHKAHEFIAVDQAYTAKLSLWKHKVIKQYARSLGMQISDSSDLEQAKVQLQKVMVSVLERVGGISPPLPVQQQPRYQIASWIDHLPLSQALVNSVIPSATCDMSEDPDRNICPERIKCVEHETKQPATVVDPRLWRTMTDIKRYDLMQSITINHPRLKPLIKELDSYAYFAERVGMRAPQCLAILGEAGVGKTTFARTWIQAASTRHEAASEEQQVKPYVYFRLPTPATPKGILAACLASLEDPSPFQGTEWRMTERLCQLIRKTSVRMLFIDECQHLINRDTQRVRFASVELIEHIVKLTNLTIVLLGSLDETSSIFRMNPRLERLVGTIHILCPFEWNRNKPETILEFRSLMRAIDHHLPFDLSGLDEEEMAYGMFYASDGILGWIMKLISYATQEALQENAATLSRSLLASAYDACIAHTTMGLGKINPFTTLGVNTEHERNRYALNEPFLLPQQHVRNKSPKKGAE